MVLNEKNVTKHFDYTNNTTSIEQSNFDYKKGEKNEVYHLQILKKDEIRMDLEQGNVFESNQNGAIYSGNTLSTKHYTLTSK